MNETLPKSTSEELCSLNAHELFKKSEFYRDAAIKVGYEWAEARHKADGLKELMPSLLAQIQSTHFEGTVSEAKMYALASKQYQDRVKELNTAQYEARLLEVEYRALMKALESLSSIAYVRNSELKLAR